MPAFKEIMEGSQLLSLDLEQVNQVWLGSKMLKKNKERKKEKAFDGSKEVSDW